MPKDRADTVIMFCIIGIVGWAIIGLPIFNSLQHAAAQQQSRSPQPASGQQQETGGEHSQPASGVSPTAQNVSQQQGGHSDQESGTKNWAKIFLDHLPDWFVALFTAVLSVFTALLWWSTDKLWKAGERQMELIAANAAQQSSDMKASIAVAEAANQLNRENIITSQRAWLHIEGVKLKHPTAINEDGIDFGIDVKIKNLGHTPATSVWVRVDAFFLSPDRRYSDARGEHERLLRQHPHQIGKTMFPNDTLEEGHIWGNGPADFAGSFATHQGSGERRIGFMLFVSVVYRVFGDDKPHVTSMIYSLLNVPAGRSLDEGQFIELTPGPFTHGPID